MTDGGSRELTVYVNRERPIEANMATAMIDRMVDKATLASSHVQALFSIKSETVGVRSVRYVEFLLPGIIAMSVMQMSVFSVAFAFAQNREKGILKRVLATPVRPYQFVTANIITRLIMSIIQAGVFTAMGLWLFHIHITGSYWLLGVCIVMGSLMFLGLGFTIAGLCKTIETVPVISNIIVFPMLFLGNVFFAASNTPRWLQPIANNLPLTYFSRALRAVMVEGAGIVGVRWDLLGVAVWGTVLITLAMFTFRLQEKDA
jgi:ABC-2 type transport system permease protein